MTPDSPLRAVAFDLDGLMFNTEQLWFEVGDAILRRRGHVFTPELRRDMMGRPGPAAFGLMIERHGLADSVDTLAAESRAIFAELLPSRLAPLPGLVELLDALAAAAVPRAVCTSSRRSFVADVFSQYDIGPHFAFVLTGDDVTHGKPHPEIYQRAADQFGVPPAAMLVLEDSGNGCRAAAAAGAFAVAVPGDHSRDHDFSSARLIADSLADPRIYAALRL